MILITILYVIMEIYYVLMRLPYAQTQGQILQALALMKDTTIITMGMGGPMG